MTQKKQCQKWFVSIHATTYYYGANRKSLSCETKTPLQNWNIGFLCLFQRMLVMATWTAFREMFWCVSRPLLRPCLRKVHYPTICIMALDPVKDYASGSVTIGLMDTACVHPTKTDVVRSVRFYSTVPIKSRILYKVHVIPFFQCRLQTEARSPLERAGGKLRRQFHSEAVFISASMELVHVQKRMTSPMAHQRASKIWYNQ